MDLQLQDKVALVTGASRGIGKGIANCLAAEGCRLAIVARCGDALAESQAELEKAGADTLAIVADVTERGAASKIVAEVRERFGRLDVVVNNAGGNLRKPFVETTDDEWDRLLELNLLSGLRLSRAALPLLIETKGVIINIGSIFGREAGGAGLVLYNTTKSAQLSAAKIMSLELAPLGVRVNTVAPGSILFPGGSWDKRQKADPVAIEAFIKANLPYGRFGTVDEVADVVAFLASPRANLITGATVAVDGGQSKSLI